MILFYLCPIIEADLSFCLFTLLNTVVRCLLCRGAFVLKHPCAATAEHACLTDVVSSDGKLPFIQKSSASTNGEPPEFENNFDLNISAPQGMRDILHGCSFQLSQILVVSVEL